ncbi:MAG: 4-hydroxy-3-methylbut-2-enyl diphosphate reductase [Candidatus Margulisiibacteriota bacterium]
MKIIKAKSCGFCTGVDMAYKKAVEIVRKGQKAYILGFLVHNSQVVKKLEKLGICSIMDLSEIPVDARRDAHLLVISAHGVGPKIFDAAKNLGLEIIDTTCHWVTKAQGIAKKLYEDGYQVVIVGDKEHAEVKGIKGWTGDTAIVVENPKDAASVPNRAKIGVVAQTTQSLDNFEKTVDELRKKAGGIVVKNTICSSTKRRQKEAVELAKKADLMIVIGDIKSANTKRLKELCLAEGVETYMIHSSEEIQKKWLKGKENIGITAGASTPDWVIKEIVDRLEK